MVYLYIRRLLPSYHERLHFFIFFKYKMNTFDKYLATPTTPASKDSDISLKGNTYWHRMGMRTRNFKLQIQKEEPLSCHA